jgi:hypothetical protein
MTLHDVGTFQQVMVRAYVHNLMVFATFPLLVAQAMGRDHSARSGPAAATASTSPTGNVVSIASRSFRTLRGRENRAAAVLSYGAFAGRVKRETVKKTSRANNG